MSCYFRHLTDIFPEAGIEITHTNKKEIDRLIHQFVGVEYKDCPATWRHLKQIFLTNETRRRELTSKIEAAAK
jgi:hypothetical protein